ncbi:uncharacterized protein [Physcomitrium patens]|uniref:DUF7032 domain-containing protein n=1 Tax=Physcomitrium patens TaxID=3218 RepID=A9SQQ6_PHYPA|nr:ARM REPEAT PROTEIN INTERACTING WITH ABF2-like [Physcomitrium patens]PNR36095.1 hypothetical protein PHYPA_021945 [Physcomitrium patens]|eukprot:XP_024401407.1 ARM REPEAT PROTEIN INTERACTING WITH ABF2-like [Physcomitrella patens]
MGVLQANVVEEKHQVKRQVVQYGDMNTTEAWLRQAQHLTSLAVTDAASVKAFLGRWKSIENRLLQLPALLTEMSHLHCLSDNAVCKELLKAMSETLEEARNLAMKCTELSYGGKLHTQSNLDSLCGKLDLHIHDCQLMITSGTMQENPLAICRVTPESTREAIRWTIRDLLAHLQIGSADCKQRALDSMLRLMADDDKNILMVAGQGVVTTLVHLLDASQPAIRERAAAAICFLALNDSCEHVVVAEGGIAPLVRLLDSGSSRAQERAAAGLQGLSISEENARTITAHGGISALIEVCRVGTPGAQAAAAGSLRNLAAVEKLRSSIVEDGAIRVVINLVSSGTSMARENAAATLQNLAVSDDSIRWRIVEDGALQPLLRYLDFSAEACAQEIALGALRNLAACRDNIDVLCSAGFLPRLANCLRSGPLVVQIVAAAAVCHIACSTEARRMLGEAGVIGPLVKLLDAKSNTAQEYSAQALALLLLVEENRTHFLAEDWGIVGLVLLLDTRLQEVSKQYPIAALQALSGSARCRKQMATAGACYHLRQLADMEVAGAKRLLDRLITGKFRSIITRTLMINAFHN